MNNCVDFDKFNRLNEAEEWDPVHFPNHKKAYNSFIDWYDKQLNKMNKYELIDMLSFILEEIKSDSLDKIK